MLHKHTTKKQGLNKPTPGSGLERTTLIWNQQLHKLKYLWGFSWCYWCFCSMATRSVQLQTFLRVLVTFGEGSQLTPTFSSNPALLQAFHEHWTALWAVYLTGGWHCRHKFASDPEDWVTSILEEKRTALLWGGKLIWVNEYDEWVCTNTGLTCILHRHSQKPNFSTRMIVTQSTFFTSCIFQVWGAGGKPNS